MFKLYQLTKKCAMFYSVPLWYIVDNLKIKPNENIYVPVIIPEFDFY